MRGLPHLMLTTALEDRWMFLPYCPHSGGGETEALRNLRTCSEQYSEELDYRTRILKPALTPLRSGPFLPHLESPAGGTSLLLSLLVPSHAFKAGPLGVGWLWFPDRPGSSFSASPSPGEEYVPQPTMSWKRCSHLSGDFLLRTGLPLASGPLSFAFYPFIFCGRIDSGEGAVECLRPPPKHPTGSGPLGSTCWSAPRRAGHRHGNELDLLGSRHSWPTSSQALAHFLSSGKSPDLTLVLGEEEPECEQPEQV